MMSIQVTNSDSFIDFTSQQQFTKHVLIYLKKADAVKCILKIFKH